MPTGAFRPDGKRTKPQTQNMKTTTQSTPSHSCCGGSTDHLPADPAATAAVLKNGNLDVRELPPARRHSLIFETFHQLNPGESFVLVNDHDPKPLYYQFSYEHAGRFSWMYEEQGPEVWRVRIGKARTDDPASQAAEVRA